MAKTYKPFIENCEISDKLINILLFMLPVACQYLIRNNKRCLKLKMTFSVDWLIVSKSLQAQQDCTSLTARMKVLNTQW